MAEQRMTLAALAGHLHIAAETLQRWQKQGLPGRKIGGRWAFDLEKVDEWVAVHVRAPKSDPRRADADARKAQALAELRELDLAKRRGEVISRAEVREAVGSMAKTLQRRLLGLPSHLVTLLEGKSREQMLRTLTGEIRELLEIVAATPYLEPAEPALCERCQRRPAAAA